MGGKPEGPPPEPPVTSTSLQLTFEPVYGDTSFEKPIDAIWDASQNRWIVAQWEGEIVSFDPANNSVATFLDVRDLVILGQRTRGLLGIALHPNYPQTKEIYLYYVAAANSISGLKSVVSRFSGDQEPWSIESEEVLFEFNQPNTFHQGGSMVFDNDGYLLISVGDGGVGYAYQAQSPENFFGSILRIDINSTSGDKNYAIPVDNPYVDNPDVLDEIYALGFRNPWRLSVDSVSGDIWLADVGENAREEIDRLVPGGNYGWPHFEGTSVYRPANELCVPCGVPHNPPVSELTHEFGAAAIGGHVYRGSNIPLLRGTYVWGDWVSGGIFGIPENTFIGTRPIIYGYTPQDVSTIELGENGEIYALAYTEGKFMILKEVEPLPEPPVLLSQTDFVDPNALDGPPVGAYEFDVAWPLFSEGANKRRWAIVPENSSLEFDTEGNSLAPPGLFLVKHFIRDNIPVETRVLSWNEQGNLRGFTYAWRADGSDAELLTDTETRIFNGEPWRYPSRIDCIKCHNTGEPLAIRAQQLKGADDGATLLDSWHSAGILGTASFNALPNWPAHPQPDDDISIDEKVRTYLDVNCSFCHRPGGPGGGSMDLRKSTALEDTNLCNSQAEVDPLGLTDPKIIEPGDPSRSVLYLRLQATQDIQMPPKRQTQDTDALAFFHAWITDGACEGI